MTQGNFFTGTNAGGNGLEVTDSTTTNFDVNKIILGTGLSISSSLGRTVTIQSSGGGGGSPGGANTQVQFNDAGSFGGSANFTFDGTTVEINGTSGGTADHFRVSLSGGTVSTPFVVDEVGHVGIGATNPVAGAALTLNGDGSTYEGIMFQVAGDNKFRLVQDGSAFYLDGQVNTYDMRVRLKDNNGNFLHNMFSANTVGELRQGINIDNAANVDAPLHVVTPATSSSATNTVASPIRMSHQTSGTPAAGIGTGIEFETQTAAANEEVGSIIESVATGVTTGDENFDMVFKNMIDGNPATQAMRIATDYQIRTGGSTTTPTGLSTVGAARLRLTGYGGAGGANGAGYEDGGLLFAENSLIQRVYTDFTVNGNIQTATFANGICLRADTEARTTLGGSYWIETDAAVQASTIATGVDPTAPNFKGAQVQLTANDGFPALINAEATQGYTAVISAGIPAVPVSSGPGNGVRIDVPANETVVLQIVGDLSAVTSYGGGALGNGVLLVLGKCTLTAY